MIAYMSVRIDGKEPQEAEELTVTFKDGAGAEYELRLHSRYSGVLGADVLDIDLTYPGGNTIGLEGITLTPFAEDEGDD